MDYLPNKDPKGWVWTYRMIRDAVDVGVFGLGEPVDVWVMSVNGGIQVSQLSKNE